MKKMNLSATAAALFLTHLACSAQPMTVDLPDDFVVFYQKFRPAVKNPSNESLLPLMCFPFKSRELSEIIDERTNKYSEKIFKKYPTLAESYLIDGIGEIRTKVGLGDIGKAIYTDPQDFIEQNADPRHPKKLDGVFARDFFYKKDQIKITSLTFEKRQGRWCWSGASYFGDPLDDIKHPRKNQREF